MKASYETLHEFHSRSLDAIFSPLFYEETHYVSSAFVVRTDNYQS